MKKFITVLLGCSLVFATVAQAKPAQQENPKNKKSKPVQQQQQVAPRQQKAPKHQSAVYHPLPRPIRVVETKPSNQEHPKKAPADQRFTDVPPASNRPEVRPKKPTPQDNARVNPNGTQQNLTTLPPKKDGSLADGRYQITARETPKTPKKLERTVPAVQSDKFKINKTVKTFQPRHQNFHARVNSSVKSVQFNQNFRIRNSQNWKGNHYNAFRTYRPQWHDRGWWHSNHNHIILIGGGWYYWNSGYWYPAWGYDESAAYYPYDGPIYVGDSPKPFDQIVADVQASLQEQGYYRGEVDGLVGPLTQEALAAYQGARGLEATAAIDQPTLESLGMG